MSCWAAASCAAVLLGTACASALWLVMLRVPSVVSTVIEVAIGAMGV